MKCSKTSLKGIRMMVFFRNIGRMHWVTYVIFQDLKIIEEFDPMGPTKCGRILKGLYQWLFPEYKRIGIHLDSSEWRLYPTRRTTPRQRNGLDCGAFSILYALHLGLRLNITNISQQQMPQDPF
jgi:Ulp1 family protease